MKFDVIVGNPPYNNNNADKSIGKAGATRNDILWPKFVAKSLTLLKDGGYLCYVHPSLWRKPGQDLWGILTSKQISYLSMHSKIEGQQTFGAATRFDWYILRNAPCSSPTTVRSTDGKVQSVDLRDYQFLASAMLTEIDKIVAKGNEERCEVIYSTQHHGSKTKPAQNKAFSFEIVHSISADGPTIKYSTRDDNVSTPKVILNEGETLYPINDWNGKLGMSEQTFGIPISSKKEGEIVIAALNSNRFREIVKATKWSQFRTEYKMFRAFKKDFWRQFVDENGNAIE